MPNQSHGINFNESYKVKIIEKFLIGFVQLEIFGITLRDSRY
jgi:hypothetical protein